MTDKTWLRYLTTMVVGECVGIVMAKIPESGPGYVLAVALCLACATVAMLMAKQEKESKA